MGAIMDDIFRLMDEDKIKPVKPTGKFIFRKGFHPPDEHIGSIMVRVLQGIADKYVAYHTKLVAEDKHGKN